MPVVAASAHAKMGIAEIYKACSHFSEFMKGKIYTKRQMQDMANFTQLAELIG